MDVNYFGAVRLTNLVVNSLIKENNSGNPRRNYTIVNIGSIQSYLGLPYRSACK